MNISDSAVNASEFTFKPVIVDGGRKFRGFAYLVSVDSNLMCYGYKTGVQLTAKLWEPNAQKFVYATEKYLNDTVTEDSSIFEAKKAYIQNVIESTISWCEATTNGASAAEKQRFARNVLLKHHAELKPVIDEVLPDNVDIVDAVERTLNWAMGLRTRSCYMYGKWCAGGHPLPVQKKLNIAYKALHKKGFTAYDGFDEAWTLSTTLMGLADEGVKAAASV